MTEALSHIQHFIASITVYSDTKKDALVDAFRQISRLLEQPVCRDNYELLLGEYARLCSTLYRVSPGGSLSDYLFELALYDDNQFTRTCASNDFFQIPRAVKQAAVFDLNALCAVSQISCETVKEAIAELYPEQKQFLGLLPGYETKHQKYKMEQPWGDHILKIAEFNRSSGVGIFSRYNAFSYSEEHGLIPVKNFDPIRLSDLKHYELQRQKIVDNTLGFLEGKPYNNVLLYGDRGTGKSSTVKALLNEYKNRGLRIVEIPKQHLLCLDRVVEQIADLPMKFILFIDDLAFNEDDKSFGILKAMLEGSVFKRPDNIAIYATTNRRHIIKETFAAREGDEVHRADTIDEALSLSDRFGLCVTFTVPTKDKYLDIVRLLAKDRALPVDSDELLKGAERFALSKGGRSPRLARQYVDNIESRLALNLPLF